MRQKLLVLLGPTAVGKTALSLDLAERLGAEIISGDSMLVYRGFDIGTAKPTRAERRGIAHHLIDCLAPREPYSVARFQQEATRLIEEVASRGALPFVVGGTGLYLKALLEGYVFNETAATTARRSALYELAAREGRSAVYEHLLRIDPVAAESVAPDNLRRVIRAIEVAEGGETISRRREGAPIYDALVLGLTRERAALYERINARVDLMMEAGLEREVRHLLASGVTEGAPPMKGIGYKEIIAYLEGASTLAEATDTIKKNTRHFAKRQMTWYRKMPYIEWIAADGKSEDEILDEALEKIAGFYPPAAK